MRDDTTSDRLARATALRAAVDTVGEEYSSIVERRVSKVLELARQYELYIQYGRVDV